MPLFELSFIYRDFCGATAKKCLKYQAFRQIQTRPKPPSKITKQPLTYKTRNQVVLSGSWVRIPPCPPKKNLTIDRKVSVVRFLIFFVKKCFYSKQFAVFGMLNAMFNNRCINARAALLQACFVHMICQRTQVLQK